MEFWQKGDNIFVSQSKYAYSLLKHFHMEDSKPKPTPMELGLKLTKEVNDGTVNGPLYRKLVGSLIYLTNTRPDISYVIGVVARFMSAPSISHWKAAKCILRYVKGTIRFGLLFSRANEFKLQGYTDSD
eukprot:Gb_18983 [translate_table: standard]